MTRTLREQLDARVALLEEVARNRGLLADLSAEEKDRIVTVLTGNDPLPKGSELIDLTRFTGIPGLIDVHACQSRRRRWRPAG